MTGGFTSDPIAGTYQWTQVGQIGFVHIAVNSAASNSTGFDSTIPFKARLATSSGIPDPEDNSATVAPGLVRTSADSQALVLLKSAASNWTAAGNKSAVFQLAVKIGPAASFVE